MDDHFIRQGDLSQRMKEAGATGAIAGFALFESGNTMVDDTKTVASKKTTTEFIAGHPNWCHRVQEWGVDVHIQDLGGLENISELLQYRVVDLRYEDLKTTDRICEAYRGVRS